MFVDNQAEVHALIRGTSGRGDSNLMAAWVHAKAAALHLRIWIAWVQYKCNVSDGLSRDGLNDKWTRRKGGDLRNVRELAVSDWMWPHLLQTLAFHRDGSLAEVLRAVCMTRNTTREKAVSESVTMCSHCEM